MQSLVRIRSSEFQHRQWSRHFSLRSTEQIIWESERYFRPVPKDDAVEVDHEMLKAICEAVDIPVIAIGGITKDNVQELAGSGLCGIAVISAIFAQPDIKKAAEELKAATEKMVKHCRNKYDVEKNASEQKCCGKVSVQNMGGVIL